MTLAAGEAGVIAGLRSELSWQDEIVSSLEAGTELPIIIVDVKDLIDFQSIASDDGIYSCTVSMRVAIDDAAGLSVHRDVGNPAGMAGVLSEHCFDDATVIVQDVRTGTISDTDMGGSQFAYVDVDCELYVSAGEAALPMDATPPTLEASLADVWGITVDNANDVLYLVEGSPSTVQEADIHSFDLTDNTRRAQEITAGVHQAQYHRGLDNDGTHLYLVDDGGTRGSWVLNKIDFSTNTLVATVDLGAGAHTGCTVYGDNLEWVAVAVSRGSTTDFKVFHTSDLTAAPDEGWTDVLGEVAGTIGIGGFAYDVIGSTAICTDPARRPELDIDLGGFRIQWHDLARRNNYLWVSGTQDNGDGTASGIIEAFRLPQEVAAVAG